MIGFSSLVIAAIGAVLFLLSTSLRESRCFLTAFFDGFMMVLWVSGWLLNPPVFPAWCFPTGYCLILNPRKSNPLWVSDILVFSGWSSSPISWRNAVISFWMSSIMFLSLTIKIWSFIHLAGFRKLRSIY